MTTRRMSTEQNITTKLFVGLLSATIALLPSSVLAKEKDAKEAKETKKEETKAAPASSLSKDEIAKGWIMLYDGQTPFGWTTDKEIVIEDGILKLKGGTLTSTSAFGDFELTIESKLNKGKAATLILNGADYKIPAKDAWTTSKWSVDSKGDSHTVKTGKAFEASKRPGASHTHIAIKVPTGSEFDVRSINLRPLSLKSIFNGKDLTGWKPLPGYKSVFTVTKAGEINVKNGNGDLQSDGQWKDFVLQLDIISNGDNLNSGIFFRSIPGEFWQGYEAQIRNEWQGHSKDKQQNAKPEDRTKPIDIGTGGIYNRQPTRKVVSSDHEWFTYTILADGPHIATWVNGYQTADYTDNQPEATSARKGRFLGKGVITIQGHDPTTDLSFKNIRITELPEASDKKEK